MRRLEVAAVLLVAGCGPAAERMRAADAARCTRFGYSQGSPEWAGCVERAWEGRRQAALMMMRPPPPAPAPAPIYYAPPQRLQTTCQHIGQFTYCN